jgi:hypothetical protein
MNDRSSSQSAGHPPLSQSAFFSFCSKTSTDPHCYLLFTSADSRCYLSLSFCYTSADPRCYLSLFLFVPQRARILAATISVAYMNSTFDSQRYHPLPVCSASMITTTCRLSKLPLASTCLDFANILVDCRWWLSGAVFGTMAP